MLAYTAYLFLHVVLPIRILTILIMLVLNLQYDNANISVLLLAL